MSTRNVELATRFADQARALKEAGELEAAAVLYVLAGALADGTADRLADLAAQFCHVQDVMSHVEPSLRSATTANLN